MKAFISVLLFVTLVFTVSAGGAKEEGTSSDDFMDYLTWTKVNQETITGDETGVLGPAHEGSKGFREIYVNAIGKSVAYGEMEYPYPVGTVILKESYDGKGGVKGKLDSITIMIKREDGYDSDNGNWEYVMANGEMKISQQGKMGMCINCHNAADSKDFVFWDSTL